MQLYIATNDRTPIYQQIVSQIKQMIASGALRPGDELPPIRTLSETLIVNANTVAHAYRDLERDGYVTCQRGVGTRVARRGSPLSHAERIRLLRARAVVLVGEANHMNVSIDDLLHLVQECAEELGAAQEAHQP